MASLNLTKNNPHPLLCVWGLFFVLTFFVGVLHADTDDMPMQLQQEPLNTSLVQADLPQNLANDVMAWPLLPNEAVEDLATLFYPKNKAMQRLFVSHTLALNHQAFGAKDVSPQVVIILIPEIKALANAAPIKPAPKPKTNAKQPWNNPLVMSYSLKDAAAFFVSPELVAAYEKLLAKNAHLKDELEKLNSKLARLQALMMRLLVEAEQLFGMPSSGSMNADGQREHAVNTKNQARSVPSDETNRLAVKATPVTTPVAERTNSNSTERAKQTKNWQQLLWMPILPIALLVALMMAIAVANRRKVAALYEADSVLFNVGDVNSDLKPLRPDAFNEQQALVHQQANDLAALDFSLTKSEYKGELANSAFTYQDESEQILEQAQMYVSFGRTDVAIGLLRAQIKTMPKASLRHWLYLLDIYRHANKQAEFEESAHDLHVHYNVAIPTWQSVESAPVMAQSLEEYPHIMEVLLKIWHAEPASAKTYLDELLTDTRQNERAGFSLSVFEEIVLLDGVLVMREKMALDAEDSIEVTV